MRNFTKALVAVIGLFFLVAFLSSPYFVVRHVEVVGNQKIATSEILQVTGLDQTTNIFAFSSAKAQKALKQNQYIGEVLFDKQYTKQTIKVTISERVLSGYVEYDRGLYLYIDERGRVLETHTFFTEKLPVMVGLEFSEFTIGEVLEVQNQNAFNTVVILAGLFNKYEMVSDVVKVDVTNELDIHLYIKKIDVTFGDISDADEKIRTINVIMENLPDQNAKGFLTIKNVNKPVEFKLLS